MNAAQLAASLEAASAAIGVIVGGVLIAKGAAATSRQQSDRPAAPNTNRPKPPIVTVSGKGW